MSKKTASKRRDKRRKAKKSNAVRGKARKYNAVPLKDKLQNIYNMINLETTCCRQGVCCLVACPQMNYSEAMQILDRVWTEWSGDEKRKLIMKCLRFYFSNSMVKACPLLGKDDESGCFGCRVYEDRPLMCRLYGMWPEATYNRRVKRFESATGFEKKDLPLNTQCTHVKRVDNSIALTDEVINGLTSSLDLIDAKIGEYTPEEIEKRHNYMTIHDWVLQKFFGDENMTTLTDFLLAATKEEIEEYLEAQEKAMLDIKI